MGLTFYATMALDTMPATVQHLIPPVPILLPASSYARYKTMSTPRIPPQITDTAADSGGFTATVRWGDYRYTPSQYVEWLRRWTPGWAATFDFCCEDEITSGKPGIVRDRQARTTDLAYQFWNHHAHEPWAWVPTIQGWHPEDYHRHASEMRPLVDQMKVRPRFRVGIGTLCRRERTADIAAIVEAVAAALPGIPLHLWGTKIRYFEKVPPHPQVVSVDSAAWNFRAHRNNPTPPGMTQREWQVSRCLPAYINKFEEALCAHHRP